MYAKESVFTDIEESEQYVTTQVIFLAPDQQKERSDQVGGEEK